MPRSIYSSKHAGENMIKEKLFYAPVRLVQNAPVVLKPKSNSIDVIHNSNF